MSVVLREDLRYDEWLRPLSARVWVLLGDWWLTLSQEFVRFVLSLLFRRDRQHILMLLLLSFSFSFDVIHKKFIARHSSSPRFMPTFLLQTVLMIFLGINLTIREQLMTYCLSKFYGPSKLLDNKYKSIFYSTILKDLNKLRLNMSSMCMHFAENTKSTLKSISQAKS